VQGGNEYGLGKRGWGKIGEDFRGRGGSEVKSQVGKGPNAGGEKEKKIAGRANNLRLSVPHDSIRGSVCTYRENGPN